MAQKENNNNGHLKIAFITYKLAGKVRHSFLFSTDLPELYFHVAQPVNRRATL
jgi:hypothetical protein